MTPISPASLCALLVLAGSATAQDADEFGPWYLDFSVGITNMEDSQGLVGDVGFDSGIGASLLFGYELEDALGDDFGLAIEFEGFFSEQSVDTRVLAPGSATPEQFSNNAFLINGVIDYQLTDKISLYGGAGAGIAGALDLDSKGDSPADFDIDDDFAFAYQGKAGARYLLGGNYSWFLQYRYFATEDLEALDSSVPVSFDLENRQSVFEVGVHYGL